MAIKLAALIYFAVVLSFALRLGAPLAPEVLRGSAGGLLLKLAVFLAFDPLFGRQTCPASPDPSTHHVNSVVSLSLAIASILWFETGRPGLRPRAVRKCGIRNQSTSRPLEITCSMAEFHLF